MKLATAKNGHPDGRLLIVSRDLSRGAEAEAARTMQDALDRWDEVEAGLRAQFAEVEAGAGAPIDPGSLLAVLPRSYQFLDASAFLAHNHILAEAWDFEPRAEAAPPLMYQGLSNVFYPPHGSVAFRGFEDDVDFEAEIGVIVDAVPIGTKPDAALNHVKLILIINDWSLRAFGPEEMKGGFGFLHAKPPSTLSAFAVTPDELGNAWSNGRVALPLTVHRNSEEFGHPNGSAMHFGFGELIAHAATTRDVCAGTVIGSGTVSNFNAAEVGSACIAERRALDAIEGKLATPYLRDGDVVRIELLDEAGRSLVGVIEQMVAPVSPA